MSPFQPGHVNTVNVNVSSSSQRVQITTHKRTPVRIYNDGTATVWIEFGDTTVVAALATGIPVGPGVTEVLTGAVIHPSSDGLNVAVIAAGSTGKIYFTPGDGI